MPALFCLGQHPAREPGPERGSSALAIVLAAGNPCQWPQWYEGAQRTPRIQTVTLLPPAVVESLWRRPRPRREQGKEEEGRRQSPFACAFVTSQEITLTLGFYCRGYS